MGVIQGIDGDNLTCSVVIQEHEAHEKAQSGGFGALVSVRSADDNHLVSTKFHRCNFLVIIQAPSALLPCLEARGASALAVSPP